jgi:hypothetical protein
MVGDGLRLRASPSQRPGQVELIAHSNSACTWAFFWSVATQVKGALQARSIGERLLQRARPNQAVPLCYQPLIAEGASALAGCLARQDRIARASSANTFWIQLLYPRPVRIGFRHSRCSIDDLFQRTPTLLIRNMHYRGSDEFCPTSISSVGMWPRSRATVNAAMRAS